MWPYDHLHDNAINDLILAQQLLLKLLQARQLSVAAGQATAQVCLVVLSHNVCCVVKLSAAPQAVSKHA